MFKRIKKSVVVSILLTFMMLVLAVPSVGYAGSTQTVLNFDELTGAGLLATDYGGLDWQPGWVYNSYPSMNYLPHSGATRINFIGQNYMGATGPSAWIDFSPLGTDVTFDGAWFGGHSATGDIWFEGWRDGVHVATSSHLTIDASNAYTTTYLAADFGQLVDKVYVVVTSEALVNQFCMDDLAYTITTPDVINVNIDIKPNDTNDINLKLKGLLPVGIFGSDEFDVTAIIPETVKIGDVGIAPLKSGALQFAYEDINLDGYMDMITKFNLPDLIDGGALSTSTTDLTVVGDLMDDGGQFTGTDVVNILIK